jgi:uncharacterized membrane protein YqjE
MHEERTEELKTEPIGDLVGRLAAQMTTLVRQEIELAKVESAPKLHAAGAAATLFGIALGLALGAFGAVTAGLIAAIALALPVWAAAAIVAIVYAIGAIALLQSGKRRLAQAAPLVPPQTAQSVKEDIEWLKTRAQSGRR